MPRKLSKVMNFKITKSKRNFNYFATYSGYYNIITLMKGCNECNIIDIINHETIHMVFSLWDLDEISLLFDISKIYL
ncbi:MAG TPA: hypothetical protein VGB37_09735 [Candidatus Lokiarchaeia archaeon]